MNFSKYIFFILIIAFATSCGSKKKATEQSTSKREIVKNNPTNKGESIPRTTPSSTPTRYENIVEEYIHNYAEIAQEEMRLYKIPASITLAQGILESGAGRGSLSVRANNHFGIKCHEWQGDRVYHDDDESQECFRKYNNPKYSYRDHSLFLAERRRYANLFDLDIDDYKGWAKGLKDAGYATDRLYPRKLIDIIERYSLFRFDAEVLGKSTREYIATAPASSNSTQHLVQKGDTLYSIARRYNTTVAQIQENNNMRDTTISIGQILYINAPQDF